MMTLELDPVVVTTSVSPRRSAVVAACMGNFIEYYDFVVYGYFATVIAKLFFPAANETVSLLLTFAAFALSYVARPIGAIIFGSIGDRYGRRVPLTIAILLIASCTTVIGLMPTYASIGIAAPIILTTARLLQGLSVGGEYGGALAFISEYSPDHRRGFFTAWQTFTIGLALIVGAGAAALLTAVLSTSELESWGWRLPFLAGVPLGFVGLYMRLKLEETPHFAKLQEHKEVDKAPLRNGIRHEWRSMLVAMGLITTPALCIYIYFIYSPTYLKTQLGYTAVQSQTANLISLVFYVALLPLFAHMCDRVGRRPLLLVGAAAVAIITYPAFTLLNHGNIVLATVALCVMGLAFAPISATALVAMAEIFPTTFRYTGLSLSLNIPVTLFGGTAPLVATALIAGTGNILSPALLVVGAAVISFAAAFAYRETLGSGLRESAHVPNSRPGNTSWTP